LAENTKGGGRKKKKKKKNIRAKKGATRKLTFSKSGGTHDIRVDGARRYCGHLRLRQSEGHRLGDQETLLPGKLHNNLGKKERDLQ